MVIGVTIGTESVCLLREVKQVVKHSFQICEQTSPRLTPRSFFTIVHHGDISVMIISWLTRGRVAGSSLAVKAKSLSLASGLNPPVWPEWIVSSIVEEEAQRREEPVAMLNRRWKSEFEPARIGLSSRSDWRRYKSVCESTGPSEWRKH